MSATRTVRAGVLLAAVVGSSCVVRVPDQRTASMEELGSRLTYLTAAVRAAVLDGALEHAMPDRAVVLLATRHDPQLARPFDTYVVGVSRAGRHVIVLVCTPDGQTALLEDASCTPGLDARRWEASPPPPCEFSLAANVCGEP